MSAATISMIATDGKVRWVEEDRVASFADRGWRVIVNPKESYYPQYDQAINKPKDDVPGNSTRVLESGYENVLGIVVV